MKTIDCSTRALPLICKILNYMPSTYAQVISCMEDGVFIAGVVYDGYNGGSIGAHIWVDDGKRPSKEWFAAIFDYPFNVLGVKKIIGQVKGSNDEAHALDRHFGFIKEADIAEYYDDGDSLVIYSMTKDQCRILTSPTWAKVTNIVGGARNGRG